MELRGKRRRGKVSPRDKSDKKRVYLGYGNWEIEEEEKRRKTHN